MVSTRRSNRVAALSSESLSLSDKPLPSNKNARKKKIKSTGPGTAEQKSSGRETMGALGKGTAHSQQNESFLLFPKLPLELQRLVWLFASSIIPQASPQIFQLAPDPKYWFIVDEALNGSRLSIFPDQPLSPPSLLLACRESRMAAYRDYVRWAATYPNNSVPSGKWIYLNKVCDTVYLKDRTPGAFAFLNLLQQYRRLDQRSRYKRGIPALQGYLDQLSEIRNIAIPWRNLVHQLSFGDYTMPWLQNLPSLKELTIIVGSTEKEQVEKTVLFLPVMPGTVRAAYAEKIMWWTGKCLEAFRSKFSDHTLPRVLVATTSNARITRSEVSHMRFVDFHYVHSGQRRFGPYLPDT